MDTEQLIEEVTNALKDVGCTDIISSGIGNVITFRFNCGGSMNSIHSPTPTPGWESSPIELDAMDGSRNLKVTYSKLLP